MVRLFKVKDASERKRVLVVQSDVYRQTLKLQVASAQVAIDNLKSHFASLEMSSFALKTVADVAGLFGGGRSRNNDNGSTFGGGFISKFITGIKVFNQVRGFFNRKKSPDSE